MCESSEYVYVVSSRNRCFARSDRRLGRDNVEGPYYGYSGRSMYDVRKPSTDSAIPELFVKYLNQPLVRQALGVNMSINYEVSSLDVYRAFQQTGDYVYPSYMEDLEYLLDKGVRVV